MLTSSTLLNGRYQLQRKLGLGGFSEVWSAQDVRTGREVAIKAFFRQDEEGIRICRREYERANQMFHPRLIRLHDFDVYQQMPYLVMPYYKNGSLGEQAGELDEQTLWMVVRDIGSALEYLHGLNPPMIHNDLKPDNFLISNDASKSYILSDFGISAELTEYQNRTNPAGVAPMAYRAPELFDQPHQQAQAVKASDIWAFGACLYELASGETPFGEQGGLFQLIHHREKGSGVQQSIVEYLPGHFSTHFSDLVYQCLHLEPWQRPRAKELVETAQKELERFQPDWQPVEPTWVAAPAVVPGPITGQSTAFSLQLRVKRRFVTLGLLIVIVAILGIGAYVMMDMLSSNPTIEGKVVPIDSAYEKPPVVNILPSNDSTIQQKFNKIYEREVPPKNQGVNNPQGKLVPTQKDNGPMLPEDPYKDFKSLLNGAIENTTGIENRSLREIRDNINRDKVDCEGIEAIRTSRSLIVLKVVDYVDKKKWCSSKSGSVGSVDNKEFDAIREEAIKTQNQKVSGFWGIQLLGAIKSKDNATIFRDKTIREDGHRIRPYEITMIKKRDGYAILATGFADRNEATAKLSKIKRVLDRDKIFPISYTQDQIINN